MNREHKIIIGGDLNPSGKNIGLFKSGNAEQLFGPKILELFQTADFSVVNLEGALTDNAIPQKKTGPNIKAPTETINGIKNLGVKAVTLANNHITDFGNSGYAETIHTLEVAGIEHVGGGLNSSSVKTHISINCGGRNICIYSVSETFFNVPDKENAGVNIYDEWLILNEIKQLKQTHDYLIVIYHGGAEHFPYPTPQTKRRFRRMADCGADLITAQHTHCIGCEEYYNGAYFLYGQGNFSFARQKGPTTRSGLLIEIIFGETININKHLIQMHDDDCLVYPQNQNLIDFYERGLHIDDDNYIENEYKKIIKLQQHRFECRYLKSYQGPFSAILSKFLPLNLYCWWAKIYTKNQIMCNMYSVVSDRVSEDLTYCWKAIE